MCAAHWSFWHVYADYIEIMLRFRIGHGDFSLLYTRIVFTASGFFLIPLCSHCINNKLIKWSSDQTYLTRQTKCPNTIVLIMGKSIFVCYSGLLSCIIYNIYRINIYSIIINVNSSFYMTSDRNEVTAADNQITNDTYEDIEGATSNQIKKGRNFNIHLYI